MDHKIFYKDYSFQRINIIILVILNLLNIELIQCTIFPYWISSYNISSLSAIISSDNDFIVTDDCLINIKYKKDFYIYNLTTYELILLYSYPQTYESFTRDYSIIDQQNLYILTTDLRLIAYNISLMSKKIQISFNISLTYKFTSIDVTEKQILLYQKERGQIYRFSRYNFIKIQTPITFIRNVYYKMKVCQKYNMYYYIALWYSTCYIKIYKCQDNIICNLIVDQDICGSINQMNLQYIFDFNYDCSYFVQYWNLTTVRIINLNSLQTNNYKNSPSLVSPAQIYFMDNLNLNFLQNDVQIGDLYITTNNGSNLNYLIASQLLRYAYCYLFSKIHKKLFIQQDQQIKIYDLKCQNNTVFNLFTGTCQISDCPLRCNICSYNKSLNNIGCTQCEIGYNINDLGGCTINTEQTNNSNGQNSTNQTNNENIENPQIIIQQQQNNVQSFIENIFQEAAVTPISTTILIFQIFPVSFLFLRFINFWSIISFYLFVPFNLPESLRNIIQSIAKIVNSSIFNLLNINLKVQLNLQQKFPQILSQKYDLTSDFINGNLQNFSILFFAYLIIFACHIIKKNVNKNSFIGSKLSDINYSTIILTQYVSIMSSFYFFLIIMKSYGYQLNTKQKINNILHLFFFIFSTIIPFFIIILMQKKSSKKIIRSDSFQKLQTFYDCASNSFIPFSSVLGNLPFFLFFNFVFYLFSTYLAFNAKGFKINRIILSSYLIIFHLGFIILSILNKQTNQRLYQIIVLLMIIILFLGALHEVLTLIGGSLYDIYTEIRDIFFKKQQILNKFKQKKNVRLKQDKNIIFKKTNNPLKLNIKKQKKVLNLQCNKKPNNLYIKNVKIRFKIQNKVKQIIQQQSNNKFQHSQIQKFRRLNRKIIRIKKKNQPPIQKEKLAVIYKKINFKRKQSQQIELKTKNIQIKQYQQIENQVCQI